MADFQVINHEPERAILVGAAVRRSQPLFTLEDSLLELKQLADTAGIEVCEQVSQHLQQIDPATYIGSGKVDEIRELIEMREAQVVIFDDELSPRHQRELEKRLGENVRILDRSVLILDIFAQHAQTREGSLQVELAQYEYRLPRLTRQWTHLARQTGGGSARGGSAGVGLRGPGETQLEVDRREISRKISKLKNELEQVRAHRKRYRSKRKQAGIPVVALVGYTNAGKSTLLRTLTQADVYVADQLFATLDPMTRRVEMPSGRQILLTDTVGFIQKLPTTLIAAFRATLEEIIEADILIHVVDITHPNVLQQIETVEDTLAEIEVPPIPRVLVWNKMDRWSDDVPAPQLAPDIDYAEMVKVSAAEGLGLTELLNAIEHALTQVLFHTRLLIPYQEGQIVSAIYESATVESQEHTEAGVLLSVLLPHALYKRYEAYQV